MFFFLTLDLMSISVPEFQKRVLVANKMIIPNQMSHADLQANSIKVA